MKGIVIAGRFAGTDIDGDVTVVLSALPPMDRMVIKDVEATASVRRYPHRRHKLMIDGEERAVYVPDGMTLLEAVDELFAWLARSKR